MSGSTSNGPTGRTLGSATSTVVSNLDPDDASITGWTEARARGAAALEDMSDIRVFNDPDLVLIYERINEHHFGGTLPLVLVHRGCPLDPEAIARDNNPLGVTSCWQSPTPGKSYVTIHVVDRLFDEEFPDGMPRWELIAKTMLHEMAHVAVQLDHRLRARPRDCVRQRMQPDRVADGVAPRAARQRSHLQGRASKLLAGGNGVRVVFSESTSNDIVKSNRRSTSASI